MPEELDAVELIARQIRIALEAPDLSAFSDLLDPDVHWGAPDASPPTCQNREQVLSWYQAGRNAGVRARVSEILVVEDRIIVGLKVSGDEGGEKVGDETDRWVVLTVRGGRVVDIVGFEERDEALSRAGAEPRPGALT